MNPVASLLSGWQEEQSFLQVGSQVEQVHDLADTRDRDVAQARQFGIVGDRSVLDQAIEAKCQGHQTRKTRNGVGG